ncbi:uncharacterized protein LOC111706529 [Eurytemora carolleeae]|uniref:uncharacterized protein LOC111706529 n=1 Tax=Eurytemora carolleeae TaxID=1294199 RepID=UPI000C78C049|nr:uncharacterized protein LOC111706529 [Eurytemora carolleeae]|eukprot:XP_023335192.1 uncharacterized protein LOC111706529 [Eurytemora affinis]
MEASGNLNPSISILNPTGGCKLVRSSSKDSTCTDIPDVPSLSAYQTLLSSQSQSLQIEHKMANLRVSFRSGLPISRGPSPSPCLSDRLCVPSATSRASSPAAKSVKDIWLDDENDLIRSCGKLSRALGLEKSFSTSDILTSPDNQACLSNSRSESFLLDAVNLHWGKLEPNSRSLSTWVAVGDVQSSTSQLPSPQVELKGFADCMSGAQFTAADFVRSMNKSVRQNYIKKRLKVTYKALEQLSESEFDLEKFLEKSVQQKTTGNQTVKLKSTNRKANKDAVAKVLVTVHSDLGLSEKRKEDIVSTKEIERDRGKPISKYERNIMIFDWLHTLDESATFEVA